MGKREEISLANPSGSSKKYRNPSIQYGGNDNNQRTPRKGSILASIPSLDLQIGRGILEEKVQKSFASRWGLEYLLLP
jgi:hypothetical protein